MKRVLFMKMGLFMILGTALVLASCSESTKPAPEKPEAVLGDYYYSDGSYSATLAEGKTPVGIVFWLNAGNKSGKIVSLTQLTGDISGTSQTIASEWLNFQFGGKIGASSKVDGKVNMESVNKWIASSENGSKVTIAGFPAFKWCADYAAGGKAKGEWYLPAEVELRQLYAAMSGLKMVASGAGAGQINDWGAFVEMPNYANYAAARTAFNARLTAPKVGGMAMIDNQYWSSTENSGTSSLAVSFKTGETQDEHVFSLLSVRAIALF